MWPAGSSKWEQFRKYKKSQIHCVYSVSYKFKSNGFYRTIVRKGPLPINMAKQSRGTNQKRKADTTGGINPCPIFVDFTTETSPTFWNNIVCLCSVFKGELEKLRNLIHANFQRGSGVTLDGESEQSIACRPQSMWVRICPGLWNLDWTSPNRYKNVKTSKKRPMS